MSPVLSNSPHLELRHLLHLGQLTTTPFWGQHLSILMDFWVCDMYKGQDLCSSPQTYFKTRAEVWKRKEQIEKE